MSMKFRQNVDVEEVAAEDVDGRRTFQQNVDAVPRVRRRIMDASRSHQLLDQGAHWLGV